MQPYFDSSFWLLLLCVLCVKGEGRVPGVASGVPSVIYNDSSFVWTQSKEERPALCGIFILEEWCQLNINKYIFNKHVLGAQRSENINKRGKITSRPLEGHPVPFVQTLVSGKNYSHNTCGHWRKELISESEVRGDVSPWCFLALWQWAGSLVAMGLSFLTCKKVALTHQVVTEA